MTEYIKNPISGKLRGVTYEDGKIIDVHIRDTDDVVKVFVPVRHGQWIEYTKVIIPEPYNKWEQAWKCSECGFDDGFVAYNYCPNCGARMEGDWNG